MPKGERRVADLAGGQKGQLRLLAEGAPFFHLELTIMATVRRDTLVQAVLEGETLSGG